MPRRHPKLSIGQLVSGRKRPESAGRKPTSNGLATTPATAATLTEPLMSKNRSTDSTSREGTRTDQTAKSVTHLLTSSSSSSSSSSITSSLPSSSFSSCLVSPATDSALVGEGRDRSHQEVASAPAPAPIPVHGNRKDTAAVARTGTHFDGGEAQFNAMPVNPSTETGEDGGLASDENTSTKTTSTPSFKRASDAVHHSSSDAGHSPAEERDAEPATKKSKDMHASASGRRKIPLSESRQQPPATPSHQNRHAPQGASTPLLSSPAIRDAMLPSSVMSSPSTPSFLLSSFLSTSHNSSFSGTPKKPRGRRVQTTEELAETIEVLTHVRNQVPLSGTLRATILILYHRLKHEEMERIKVQKESPKPDFEETILARAANLLCMDAATLRKHILEWHQERLKQGDHIEASSSSRRSSSRRSSSHSNDTQHTEANSFLPGTATPQRGTSGDSEKADTTTERNEEDRASESGNSAATAQIDRASAVSGQREQQQGKGSVEPNASMQPPENVSKDAEGRRENASSAPDSLSATASEEGPKQSLSGTGSDVKEGGSTMTPADDAKPNQHPASKTADGSVEKGRTTAASAAAKKPKGKKYVWPTIKSTERIHEIRRTVVEVRDFIQRAHAQRRSVHVVDLLNHLISLNLVHVQRGSGTVYVQKDFQAATQVLIKFLSQIGYSVSGSRGTLQLRDEHIVQRDRFLAEVYKNRKLPAEARLREVYVDESYVDSAFVPTSTMDASDEQDLQAMTRKAPGNQRCCFIAAVQGPVVPPTIHIESVAPSRNGGSDGLDHTAMEATATAVTPTPDTIATTHLLKNWRGDPAVASATLQSTTEPDTRGDVGDSDRRRSTEDATGQGQPAMSLHQPGYDAGFSVDQTGGVVPGTTYSFTPNKSHAKKPHKGDFHKVFLARIFKRWFTTQLLPNLSSPSLIILDNAPYHTFRPKDTPQASLLPKLEVIQKLEERGLIGPKEDPSTMMATTLRERLNAWVEENVEPEICTIAAQRGHKVVFLPPYHPELSPIEKLWSGLKAHIGLNCRNVDLNPHMILSLIEAHGSEFLHALSQEEVDQMMLHRPVSVFDKVDERLRLLLYIAMEGLDTLAEATPQGDMSMLESLLPHQSLALSGGEEDALTPSSRQAKGTGKGRNNRNGSSSSNTNNNDANEGGDDSVSHSMNASLNISTASMNDSTLSIAASSVALEMGSSMVASTTVTAAKKDEEGFYDSFLALL